MTTGASWYKTGFSGVNEEKERLAMLKAGEVDRFFMKEGAEAQLVFVDDEPFTFHEHGFYRDGDRDVLTCIGKLYPDKPVCCQKLGEKSAYYVGYLTVLDCTQYQGKKDPTKTYAYGVKLFPAKLTTLETLNRKKTEHASLVNIKTKVFRDKGKTPTVGNEFTFVEAVKNMDAMFSFANYQGKKFSALFDEAENDALAMKKLAWTFQLSKDPEGKLIRRIPPFNYANLLAPRTPEAVTRLLTGNITTNYEEAKRFRGGGGAAPSGSGAGSSEGAPF